MTRKRDPRDALVRALRDYQRQFGLTDGAVAEQLGVRRTTWVDVRLGKARPGVAFLRAVARLAQFRALAVAVITGEEVA